MSNLLVEKAPEVAAQWHPTKNTLLSLETVTAGSGKKAWWVCSRGHEWFAVIQSRVRGNGCPDCSGRRTQAGLNDLASLHPQLVPEWHPTRNQYPPSHYQAQSNKTVWWKCASCMHEWPAIIQSRSKNGTGCPACAGNLLLPGVNDLQTLFPEIAAEWHPSNEMRAEDVHAHSNSYFMWSCRRCSHGWSAMVNNRTGRGSGCPACAGRAVTDANNLAATHPEIAAEWHPTKNGDLTAVQVTAGAERKVWWLGVCGHEWGNMSVYSRTGTSSQGCPICAGKQVLEGFNDLATVAPEVAAVWHPTKNGEMTPQELSRSSNVQAWWKCAQGHETYGRVAKRRGCPVCLNQAVVTGVNDMAATHPQLAAEWHPTKNRDLTPEQVVAGTNKMIHWLCVAKGHEWSATGGTRLRPAGCPECSAGQQFSKAERDIGDWLEGLGLTVERNKRKLLDGRRLELDLYLPDQQLAIEYNGLYWHSETRGKDRNYHRTKWAACKEQGIQLIQVWEDEWNRNPEQVKKMLAHKAGVLVPGERKVMARKTQVTTLTKKQAEAFLDEHHVQGHADGSYYLSLAEAGNPESVVAVLVLKKEAGTEGRTLNIVRYATAATVPGGFTKLLKHAERTYQPDSFITFSDHCVSDGGLYRNNGFIADKELPPDYMYLVQGERKHKFGYRLKRFRNDPELVWVEGMTERELAQLNGLHRIWDAGKTRWVKHVTVE